jgi:CHAT domain-containing protein
MRDLALDLRRTDGISMGLREAPDDPGLRRSDLRSASARIQREYADLLAEMRTKAPEYSYLVDPELTSPDRISSLLGDDRVLLEYLSGDDATMVFVVTADTVAVVPLGIGGEDLADMVGFARGVIDAETRRTAGGLWRSPMERLYGSLIEPIADTGLLDGKKSLVIVPHGVLHYLPFQALIEPARGAFLAERYEVAYSPSASTWVRLQDQAMRKRSGEPPHRSGESFRVLALAPRIDELPGSRYETEVLRGLFGDRASVFTGKDASEVAFRQEAGEYDIVHLATYGWLNKANPLFSRVELAETTTDPGLLEVHEIYGMRFNADLLTLSACETALGSGSLWDVPPGDDWTGLASAFLGAGATNVLASLWRVEDLATANLMERFYGHLANGQTTAQALARAQRELISDPETAHPFYWAGFLLIGEGGGIG